MMDDTKAAKAIRDTLQQPRVGLVTLRLHAKPPWRGTVYVSADYEPDRSLKLTARLEAGLSDADRESLAAFGWQPSVGPTGAPDAALTRAWPNATADTAVDVATEARRALEIAASDMRPREPLAVGHGDGGMGQAGCVFGLPSFALALGIVAILRLRVGLPPSAEYFGLLALIGMTFASIAPGSAVSLAARVPGLRPHLEAIALGSAVVLAGAAILIANQILTPP